MQYGASVKNRVLDLWWLDDKLSVVRYSVKVSRDTDVVRMRVLEVLRNNTGSLEKCNEIA